MGNSRTPHPLVLSNGRPVGQTVGLVAMLPVTSRNYLAVASGYSIDANVLRAIEVRGCERIEFRHRRTGRVFRIPVATFKAEAKVFNYGLGEKLAAHESFYERAAPAAGESVHG